MPRTYVPCYIDYYQSETYRLVAYTVDDTGRVTAHFADGQTKPSLYVTETDLLKAHTRGDWRERVALTSSVS